MAGITIAQKVVAAPSLVVEYTTPTYVVTAARAPVVEFIARALAVFAIPALVVEYIEPAPARPVDENVAPATAESSVAAAPAEYAAPASVAEYIVSAVYVLPVPNTGTCGRVHRASTCRAGLASAGARRPPHRWHCIFAAPPA